MRDYLLIACMCAMVLGVMVVLDASIPVVDYSTATRQPVGCYVEPDANGVNWLPASDSRCQSIIEGRHEVEWVP